MPIINPKPKPTPKPTMYGSKPWGSRGHVLPKPPPSVQDAAYIAMLKGLGAAVDISMVGKIGLLKTSHVLFLTGYSHSTLYRKIQDGIFPLPHRQATLQEGKSRRGSGNRWLYQDVMEHMAKHKVTVG